MHGREEKRLQVVVKKPKEKRQLWRSKRRCKEDIKMDPKEMVWEDMLWINISEDGESWRTLTKW
jgi:hypothetical protein